jgi:hypothetical protein
MLGCVLNKWAFFSWLPTVLAIVYISYWYYFTSVIRGDYPDLWKQIADPDGKRELNRVGAMLSITESMRLFGLMCSGAALRGHDPRLVRLRAIWWGFQAAVLLLIAALVPCI